MGDSFTIRPLKNSDIRLVTQWAREEGFAPGAGDFGIYRHTDQQGLWIGCLNGVPIGCIAGVRYNKLYGFIGLYLVVPEHRGKGFGIKLWQKAIKHLETLPCVGLEAALNRVEDYAKWGFQSASPTTRWQSIGRDTLNLDDINTLNNRSNLNLLEGKEIPSHAVHSYDERRETTPRPHFLSDWLNHPAGQVLALVDNQGFCHGFGRIRPCLLKDREGWRIGPLLADTPLLAKILLENLIIKHPGVILLDSPGANTNVENLLKELGFKAISQTLRMYRGQQPHISLNDVYGLACLELG